MNFPGFPFPVEIEYAHIPETLTNASASGVCWQAAAGRFLLNVPGVARYLAEAGHKLLIQPEETASEAQLEHHARLAPLAALAFQRGWLAFHAAAVLPPRAAGQGAILLAGDSGSGKSTLLAGLIQQGWQMLSDEIALVSPGEDGKLWVSPGQPELRLFPDAVEKLAWDAACLADARIAAPRQLQFIYQLRILKIPRAETSTVSGMSRFHLVNALLYNTHIADALLDRETYFRLSSALMQSVDLRQLSRPRGEWSLPGLIQALQSEILPHPVEQ